MSPTVIDLTAPSSPIDFSGPDFYKRYVSRPVDKLYQPLEDAIDETTPDRVRQILRTVCLASSETRELVERLLLVDDKDAKSRKQESIERGCNSDGEIEDPSSDEEGEDNSESSVADDDDEASSSDATGGKVEPKNAAQADSFGVFKPLYSMERPRPRYGACEKCDEEFDITLTGKYDYVWHDGNVFILQGRKCLRLSRGEGSG